MWFPKNERGFSLVEIMVGMAIVAAGAVIYSQSESQKLKHESQRRANTSLDELVAKLKLKLKDPEVCHTNMHKAFDGVNMNTLVAGDSYSPDPFVAGEPMHTILLDKPYWDGVSATPTFDELLKPNMEWDNGKVFVENLQYRIYDKTVFNQAPLPFTMRGKMRIAIDLARCQQGAAAFRMVGGLKTPVCKDDQIKRSRKYIDMVMAYRQVGTTIEKGPGRRWDVPTKKWVDDPAPAYEIPILSCAESEEGLIAQARQYTDERICDVQIEMMLATGRPGINDCGKQVVKRKRFVLRTSGSGNHAIQSADPIILAGKVKSQVNKNSYTGFIVGGGGGGGSGCDGLCGGNKAGRGGRAGELKVINLPGSVSGTSCNLVSGSAGPGREDKSGGGGGTSQLTCNGYTTSAVGGGGGSEKAFSDCNNAGRIGEPITIDGVLSPGGAKLGCWDKGLDGVRGAGGAGAGRGEEWGANGGAGVVKITWEELVVVGDTEDPVALQADLAYP